MLLLCWLLSIQGVLFAYITVSLIPFQFSAFFIKLAHKILVYVTAREGVKLGINFTSCSMKGNEIARGTYFAVIATTSGIYPKISLMPVMCMSLRWFPQFITTEVTRENG